MRWPRPAEAALLRDARAGEEEAALTRLNIEVMGTCLRADDDDAAAFRLDGLGLVAEDLLQAAEDRRVRTKGGTLPIGIVGTNFEGVDKLSTERTIYHGNSQ